MLAVGTAIPAPVVLLVEKVVEALVLVPEVELGAVDVMVVVPVATAIVPKIEDAISDSVDAAAVCTPSQKIEMDEPCPYHCQST